MKHTSNQFPNDMDMFLIAPLAVEAISKARNISQKEITEHMDHVNELIERPREDRFAAWGLNLYPIHFHLLRYKGS